MGMNNQPRTEETPVRVLFIVGASLPAGNKKAAGEQVPMRDGEKAIKAHLESIGYQVEVKDEMSFKARQVEGKDEVSFEAHQVGDISVILLSSTVKEMSVADVLCRASVPVIVSNGVLLGRMGMINANAGGNYGTASCDEPVWISDPKHSMAAGLKKVDKLYEAASSSPLNKVAEEAVEIALKTSRARSNMPAAKAEAMTAEELDEELKKSQGALLWAIPHVDAIKIAVLSERRDQALIFGYELCAKMFGSRAPARRVGLFLDEQIAPGLAGEGWALFDAAVEWAIGDEARQFTEIFKEEWQEIRERRKVFSKAQPDEDECTPPDNLVGLALSGGGIRSATFCLGLLQGLHDLRFLHAFDYLSTVSGGGYLGGWWSAWLSRDDSTGLFPTDERLELDRARGYLLADQDKVAEGSMSAERDPVHHLRLFANYLTPRKGLLSADTWRAIAVITRNLMMTWLMLLPLLVSFVLAGQLFFALQTGSKEKFAFPFWAEIARGQQELTDLENQLKLEREKKYPGDLNQAHSIELDYLSRMQENAQYIAGLKGQHTKVLLERAGSAALLIIPLAGWIVYMVGIWLMRNTSGSKTLAWIGGLTVWLLIGITSLIFNQKSVLWFWDSFKQSPLAAFKGLGGVRVLLLILGWVSIAALLWFYACRKGQPIKDSTIVGAENKRQVQINRIMRVHVRLLVILVVTAAMLALGGFGHELVEYVFQPDNSLIVRSGGWGAIASAIAGSIFTAVKGSPMGGGDTRANKTPSLTSRIIFAVTPPLVLIVLALTAAWLARWAFYYTANNYLFCIPLLTVASFIGVVLWLIFAVNEMKRRRSQLVLWVVRAMGALIIISGATTYLLVSNTNRVIPCIWPLAIIILASSLILVRILVAETKGGADEGHRVFKFVIFEELLKHCRLNERELIGLGLALAGAAALQIALLLVLTGKVALLVTAQIPSNRIVLACAASTGLLICVVLIFFEMLMGRGSNSRSRWLLCATYFVLTALLVTTFYGNYQAHSTAMLAHAAIVLLAIVFSWVVALGWMADPNALSLHTFYKGRLVRAYMGASNLARHYRQSEITDAVEGDDVSLTSLKNCQRGAPYHLINTTLNLVGGRDLTTAQRSSAAFVLTKHYCGSSRTGYRKTKKYMNGRLSLGAAVAASGAAVSPNMGSLRTSASLAMLMTLLNVRLGYWAPTPSKNNWRLSKTRLWPFYMVREFLSQTNDLSTYCYLTDGGHFENTALYSLVERGCRYIVLSDNAADPEPCFADLGNAIRRCRIDFKTDIQLDITPFIKQAKDDRFARQHYAVGRIIYSKEHVDKLGWTDTANEEKRTGVIVYIKPALVKEEGDLPADVRQYEIENGGFPQQTTVDQWFDEAQFESYRQLGYHCANVAFEKIKFGRIEAIPKYEEAFKKWEQGESLDADEELLLGAKDASFGITHRRSVPKDIETLFKFFYAFKPQ